MNKRNKAIIIISIVLLIIAATFVILGFALSNGWQSVVNWFTSTYAVICYIVVGGWLLMLGYMLIGDWIKRK